MKFEFATATQIVFGSGRIQDLSTIAEKFGRRALLVSGRRTELALTLRDSLQRAAISAEILSVPCEPTVALIQEGTKFARQGQCELVIAIGGGSVIDAGKAIAAMLANPGELIDYLEVVGRGETLRHVSRPFIAIPTTAGTGAEVTRNAVLSVPERGVKASLRSPLMLPTVALVDPQLTHELPPALTASTGLDALTQLIEPFTCNRANPMTDAICREGLTRAARALPRAYHDGSDAAARSDMALAGLFGGLALANAGLGAAHGFAAPLGGMFTAPHGAVCAALLPFVMAANIAALKRSATNSESLARYAEIAAIITGRGSASPDDGVAWVRRLVRDLAIPPLRYYGVATSDFPQLVAKAAQASSMKANPINLSPSELMEVLHAAL